MTNADTPAMHALRQAQIDKMRDIYNDALDAAADALKRADRLKHLRGSVGQHGGQDGMKAAEDLERQREKVYRDLADKIRQDAANAGVIF